MISKHATANSFYHTCRYVCVKPGAEVLVSEGVRVHDYKLMAADFLAQQELRPSKTQACMHTILSFYPGEKPTDELMKEITAKYLENIGIKETQYAIVKHTDKAHLHLHIVANMVNNQGRAISDSWIGYRGKKEAQRLTLEYKLTPAVEKNLKLTHLEALSQTEAQKYKVYRTIAELLPGCKTMEDLERKLAEQNITVQYKLNRKTAEKEGVSFKIGDLCFKGSQVDRKFSYAGLESTLALQRSEALKQQESNSPPQSELNRKFFENHTAVKRNHTDRTTDEVQIDRGKQKDSLLEILIKPQPQEQSIAYPLNKNKEKKKKKSYGLGL